MTPQEVAQGVLDKRLHRCVLVKGNTPQRLPLGRRHPNQYLHAAIPLLTDRSTLRFRIEARRRKRPGVGFRGEQAGSAG